MKKAVQHTGLEAASSSSIESYAIYAALAGGSVGFASGLFMFWGGDVSLFERGISLGFVASILGGVAALIAYLAVALNTGKTNNERGRFAVVKRHINTWSLALVHALLVFLSYALMFYIVSESFKDAHIDPWGASALVALSTGFACYITFLSAATINAVRVSLLLALFLVSGTFISMLTAGNPHWWIDHFSSLGAGGGVSGYAFNATLIIAGMVIVALSKYIADDFNKLRQGGRVSQKVKVRVLQTVLAGIGIALALVGLFVYDAYPLIHNTAAGGMAVLFLALVLVLPFLTPGFTMAFFVASYGLFAALLASVWLFQSAQYFNLTVFELVAAAIIFSWLVIFVRHIAALLDDENDTRLTTNKEEK